MLVLTRKSGEAIKVGDDVTVTIVEIRGNQVRLGINAPPNVIVHRSELYDRIKTENITAARVSIEDFKNIKETLG